MSSSKERNESKLESPATEGSDRRRRESAWVVKELNLCGGVEYLTVLLRCRGGKGMMERERLLQILFVVKSECGTKGW